MNYKKANWGNLITMQMWALESTFSEMMYKQLLFSKLISNLLPVIRDFFLGVLFAW